MVEILYLGGTRRWIVTIGNKILIVTYDSKYAYRLEKSIKDKNYDESYSLIVK